MSRESVPLAGFTRRLPSTRIRTNVRLRFRNANPGVETSARQQSGAVRILGESKAEMITVRVAKSSRRVRYLADEQLQKLVASLNSLHEGRLAIPLLIICGERAIWPLRDILLYGEVGGHSIPRPHVVWALAELGAREVLMEYLSMKKDTANPVVWREEAIVENAAAHALAAWYSEDVVSILLKKKQQSVSRTGASRRGD